MMDKQLTAVIAMIFFVATVNGFLSANDTVTINSANCEAFPWMSSTVRCPSGIKDMWLQAWKDISLDPSPPNPGTTCVHERWVCDGAAQCKEGEDEKDCPTETNDNCAEFSWMSPTVTCPSGVKDSWFLRWKIISLDPTPVDYNQPGYRCIHNDWVCDGEAQCNNGEDEEQC